MKNSYLKNVMFIGGILLLGSILYLLREKFPTPAIFTLDAIVIGVLYLFSFFSLGGVFSSSNHFGGKVASLGVLMATEAMYTLLAIGGIVAGVLVPITIEWQCVYQGLFLFLAIAGLYASSSSASRENAIYQQSAASGQSTDALRSEAELLRIRVNSSAVANSHQKERVKHLEGRMKYLSFNPSPTAQSLEGDLSTEFSRMLSLLQSLPGTSAEFDTSLTRCEILLSERIRLTITQ